MMVPQTNQEDRQLQLHADGWPVGPSTGWRERLRPLTCAKYQRIRPASLLSPLQEVDLVKRGDFRCSEKYEIASDKNRVA